MRFLVLCLSLAASSAAAPADGPLVLVGAAKADITPELPIWLSGYGGRPSETTRVEKRLFARALAIGSDAQRPVVMITLEVVGIPQSLSNAVAAALKESHGLDRAHVALSVTHTHNGPAIAGVLPFMYGKDLPADEVGRIDRYTAQLKNKLIEVGRAALQDRKPGRLAWGEGRADFAVQRRRIVNGKWTGFTVDPKGSVDHALPMLRVTGEDGSVRAVLVNYACHCTTLQGGDNFVHSDWAGEAAGRIEEARNGAVALVAIGCGADANPKIRTIPAVAEHGQKIAAEVERLLQGELKPLGAVTTASFRMIDLPFDTVVTKAELEQRRAPGAKPQAAYASTKLLARLEAGGTIPAALAYPVQTWAFGRDLAMVFLGGEVVSAYSLRLKRELDGARLWVNAYSNAVPSYIPAKTMYSEGGYEVDTSMEYYGWPTRLALGTEDQIIGVVREMTPKEFQTFNAAQK